jgi:hypothetical protein
MFTLGVENRLDGVETFTLDLDVFNEAGEQVDTNGWQLVHYETVTLERGEQQELPLLIRPSAATPFGTYTVIAQVTDEAGQMYDSKRSFSVRVE